MNEETKKDYNVLVAKKAEKLVSALYLVTDLIEDQEPIKHSLRRNAVSLLSSMNSLSQLDVKDRMAEIKHSLRLTTEILSLLHVALTAHLISLMNGELLSEGYRSLQMILEKKQPVFSKEMLHVDDEESLHGVVANGPAITGTSYDALTPLSIARLHENKEELRKNQDMLRQSQILAKFEGNKGQNKESFIKDKKEIQKDNEARTLPTHHLLMEHVARGPATITSSFQMKKLSRREQILALFVKGVDVSIKDIAARIKGCSEKTIQRELNALLYDNVIERIGEKRWSRYVLR